MYLEYVNCGLLHYDAVWSCESILTFFEGCSSKDGSSTFPPKHQHPPTRRLHDVTNQNHTCEILKTYITWSTLRGFELIRSCMVRLKVFLRFDQIVCASGSLVQNLFLIFCNRYCKFSGIYLLFSWAEKSIYGRMN